MQVSFNDFFRTNDKREALAAMDFLNTQMAQTSYTAPKIEIERLLGDIFSSITFGGSRYEKT